MTNVQIDQALLGRQQDLLASLQKFERIAILSEAIQSLKDKPYEDSAYKSDPPEPLFKVDDEVVVCSEFYYYAKIRDVRLDFECPDLRKLIPAYEVVYRDWSAPEPDREFVVEYDVLSLKGGPRYRPVEMYMAQHWNRLKQWSKQPKLKKRGMFVLDSDDYKLVEQELNERFCETFPGTGLKSFNKWLHEDEHGDVQSPSSP